MEKKVTFEGRKLEVEIDVTSWGSETSYSPMFGADGGDPVEFEIEAVWGEDGETVRLDEDAMARLHDHIAEHVEFEPPSYDDDWF